MKMKFQLVLTVNLFFLIATSCSKIFHSSEVNKFNSKNEKTGLWILPCDSNKNIIVHLYKRGKIICISKVYNSNGRLIMSGKTKNELREGLWDIYDEKGNAIFTIIYHQGVKITPRRELSF